LIPHLSLRLIMSNEIILHAREALPTKTPVTIQPIESVTIVFADGTRKKISVNSEDGTAFYKKEDFNKLFFTHTVFIVDGIEKDLPTFDIPKLGG
jgi:hypothetical protein